MPGTAELYSRKIDIERYSMPFQVLFWKQTANNLHYHDYEELVFVLEGSSIHENDGHVYSISAGDVFLIKNGSVHKYMNSKNLLIANLMYETGYLDKDGLDLREIPGFRAFFETEPALRFESGFKARLTLSSDSLSEIRLLLTKLEHECLQRSPGYRFLARAYFRAIIALTARLYNSDDQKYSRRMVTLSRMTGYIEEHFSEPVRRSQIVAEGCVSVGTASSIFLNLLHKSMIEYLLEVRIRHGRHLLENSDLPISEIAFKCGFNDSNHFSTMFRRAAGVSPREYRSKTQKQSKQEFIPV